MSRSEDGATAVVPQDLVELGRISGAYGVRGWVKIQPHVAGSAVLLKSRTWWLRRPVSPAQTVDASSAWPVEVTKSRTQGSTIVGSLQGIADRTQAEKLRGCTVWVPRSAFPAAADNEYYWVDLIGCVIYGEQDGVGALLGTVDAVMDNGAHSVLRVRRQTLDEQGEVQPMLDAKGRQLETLVPFVEAHVHTVDLANRRLDSNWPVDF
ncbi:ribosome maturation factor RimM [Achromobacter sp. F4_2707]|uniref:ribosome maturation factor RimM n=1 Tax=Achromobacter sp. F4_2707 TaxID=3114286 RepID=UPI0039C74B1D